MRINRIYLEKFKKFSYGYMFMVKRGVFLLFDKDTLEYKGIFTMFNYKEDKELDDTINRLIALDYLEV
ncbi:MAG: hypothetical protein J6S85_04650 [Methanobrevibacter sp.]|jgi:hypothetical protein|nr:hypothetical protein [Methanobrevibacter sp.]